MRRSEKEIKDKTSIEQILREAAVCRIGLCSANRPYVVPVSFVYEEGCIYIHSATDGRKIDVLKENSNISFEVESAVAVVAGENSCSSGMAYESVIGFGKAVFIGDAVERKKALQMIVAKYTGTANAEFSDDAFKRTLIIRVDIDEMTGKKSG
jgi:uncharacterized protein